MLIVSFCSFHQSNKASVLAVKCVNVTTDHLIRALTRRGRGLGEGPITVCVGVVGGGGGEGEGGHTGFDID